MSFEEELKKYFTMGQRTFIINLKDEYCIDKERARKVIDELHVDPMMPVKYLLQMQKELKKELKL